MVSQGSRTGVCQSPIHSRLGMYASGQGMLQSSAVAADWYYKAGLSYLKKGKKDDALMCVETIKDLKTLLHLNVPNAFLADKLLTTIYGGKEGRK